MKTQKKQSTLLLTLLLASCSQASDFSNSQYLGKSNAKAMKAQVHTAYFNCYALNKTLKVECLAHLNSKYIEKGRQHDKEYVQTFQFESEKLGFKRFLNDLKLPCESIKDGPEFVDDKQGYQVICQPKDQYLMQFDYNKKEWQLVNEDSND